ncbi:phosphoribosylaminoimidazolesuccinocarboxamide synthase [Prochlorococcus marinus]|uniref:Phosphoribosylaminoimidazole-succinocarboxamide synthase n=1 Tax=Prochlorococcus marinus XMU1408 TaxID=2213228 RepID=A0A318R232_PROMR|nr:phosphoribosylaminoimidazolesuccinocarboxamide synthase [Prochlorococcus marinus]MBW3042523.1 phosphoribosylaminoimidazolesuccinocarboxamide synthase [Prochlorococcus marinus str. XMU1408]PYE01449.1 phosphoribosylaminoimidazolesuccinocarboxamide synthase [Prochlorococcus marinus XMU1408]
MNHIRGSLIYEGKAKRVFECDNPERVLIEFKNDATAFNAKKRAEIAGKGRLNCKISTALFELLELNGISTHFLALQSETLMIADKVNVIPLEVVIRNIATGSLCRETPINQGTILNPPLLDFYYKDDELGDPILTEERLKLLNLISTSHLKEIEKVTRSVNKILKEYFDALDLLLVDFKLEFGLNSSGKLVIADEISPDNCRFWDKKNSDPKDRILDKDRFRQDLGGVIDAYEEILKRIEKDTSKAT